MHGDFQKDCSNEAAILRDNVGLSMSYVHILLHLSYCMSSAEITAHKQLNWSCAFMFRRRGTLARQSSTRLLVASLWRSCGTLGDKSKAALTALPPLNSRMQPQTLLTMVGLHLRQIISLCSLTFDLLWKGSLTRVHASWCYNYN